MEQITRSLDEASARRLVLARAIDDIDTHGKLLGQVERDQLEREAFEASRGAVPGAAPDPLDYLQRRATRLLAAVENRNPQVAALQHGEGWRRWLLWALPLAACLLGAAIDRVDNPQQVNMLSPPLLGVLFWNLAIYLVLLLGLVLPARWRPRSPLAGLQRRLAGTGARSGRLQTDVAARFHRHWLQATGARQVLWGKQLLHLTAAGWAIGLALSIVIGGLVRQYRVGWESTLLDLGQVHAFLSVLFAPVVVLLQFDAFSSADLQRMHFASGISVAIEEARRWVWMYLALLLLLVVLPRLALAAWTGLRGRAMARAVAIDLRDPYFVEVLARVSPARITLGLQAAPGPARDQLLRMLQQAGDRPPAAGTGPWAMLTTSKGDVLRVLEIPPGFQPPAPVVTPPEAGTSAAQQWLQDLLGRFKPARGAQRGPSELQAALAETDLVLLVAGTAGELRDATALLHWLAQPALVLVPDEGDLPACRAAVSRLSLAAEVLPLQATTAHWLRESALLQAIAPRVAPSKRPGFARIVAAWDGRNARRFEESMQLLAALLLRAAREVEEVGHGPAGLRQWVHAGEREAGQKARDDASLVLLQRLRAIETATFTELMRLHRLDATPSALPAARLEDDRFVHQQPVDTPQAGMAGAATGAAMGAGIDLMTGGLTLGAATALGALIGGGTAFVAAALKNRTAPSGQAQVQLGEEMLQTLTESALLGYLGVAHRDPQAVHAAQAPAAWRSEVIAAVVGRRQSLAALWSQARGGDPAQVREQLARELGVIARGLLGRL